MSWFSRAWSWIRGKKSDEEILNQISFVMESELSEATSILDQLKRLKANWAVLSNDQRAYYWSKIHKQLQKYEAYERVIEALDRQLTKAEENSIFGKQKKETAQMK